MTIDNVVCMVKYLLEKPNPDELFTEYTLEKRDDCDIYEWEFDGKAFNVTILHKQKTMLVMSEGEGDSCHIFDIWHVWDMDNSVSDKLEAFIKEQYKL